MQIYMRNMAWVSIEFAVKVISNFIVIGLLTRCLGTEQYGLLMYLLNTVLIFMSLSYICGAELLLPELVQHKNRNDAIISTGFVIRTVGSLVAFVMLIVYSLLVEKNTLITAYAVFLGIIIIIGENFAILSLWLQAGMRNAERSKIYICSFIVKIIFVFGLYKFNVSNLFFYLAAWVLESLIIAVGLTLKFRQSNKYFAFRYERDLIIRYLKEGLLLFIGVMLMTLFLRSDVIFIKAEIGLHSVGLYTAGMQIIYAMIAVSTIVVTVLSPNLVFRIGEKKDYARNILIISYIQLGFGIAIAIVSYFVLPKILHIFYGYRFQDSIALFKIQLLIVPLAFFETGLNLYLIRSKNALYIIYKWIGSVTLAVIGYSVFLVHFQINGVVFGIVIGYIFAILFDYICITRIEKPNIKSTA